MFNTDTSAALLPIVFPVKMLKDDIFGANEFIILSEAVCIGSFTINGLIYSVAVNYG